jgi:hypothetical protein
MKAPMMACPGGKAHSSRAVSDSSTTTCCSGDGRRRGRYSIVCYRCEMISACWRKNMTVAAAACWTIFRRRFPTSPSSTRPIIFWSAKSRRRSVRVTRRRARGPTGKPLPGVRRGQFADRRSESTAILGAVARYQIWENSIIVFMSPSRYSNASLHLSSGTRRVIRPLNQSRSALMSAWTARW